MTETEVVAESKEAPEENGSNAQEKSLLEPLIIRQVEYYFGDLNLPRDKFLREQVQLDEGWVPLDILTRFNRLAKLTKDTDIIAEALKNSSSGIIEVSEDNKKVRRNPELPLPEMNEERRKELSSRSVYVKGFPKTYSLDDCLKFFKDYQEVENVIMRKYQDRKTKQRLFKGSVFATFKSKEQAEKFLENKELKIGETELILMWQEAYLNSKQEEYASRKNKKEDNKKERKEESKPQKEEIKLPLGAALHFTGAGEKVSREEIKEHLTKAGTDVAFIDYKQGDKEGWVRLTKENSAKEVLEKLEDGKLKLSENELTLTVVEGDEEKTFLEKCISDMTKRRNFKNKNKNKGGRFHGNRKRRHAAGGDEPAQKVKATEG